MIAPLRDVDKVVILDPSLAGLSPDEVMDRIETVLRVAYPDVVFERTRHSLKIDFGPTTFNFDTVPASETTTDDDDVCIANRDSGGWDRSNTRELLRVVAERNDETKGRFIHQVRMGKQLVRNLLDEIIPGLHVESWAYIAITSPMAHDEAVTVLLETAARLLGANYTEPTGVDAISAKLKPDVIDAAKPLLVDAARRAREARNLTEAGDHNEAIRIWHELFGDCFPAPEPQGPGDALRRSFEGGSITRAGAVSTTGAGTQQSRPVRPWRRT